MEEWVSGEWKMKKTEKMTGIVALAAFVAAFQGFADVGEASLRAKKEERIREIRSTPDMPVPPGATVYYVSSFNGDDSADGRTEKTAWRTLKRLNAEKMPENAFVRFERGGVYRGFVRGRQGVTYAAYGKGAKPCIVGSPENAAVPSKWKATDVPGIWSYRIGNRDVGTVVFDDGDTHALKVLLGTDLKTGKPVDHKRKTPFSGYRDLKGDLMFWHDYRGSGELYLVSGKNPGERFRRIEFLVRQHGFIIDKVTDDVTLDNLEIRYVGAHGVSAVGICRRNLVVRNCVFEWIGGSIQTENFRGSGNPVRFGNGVEIYGGCDGYVVSNCYFRQIYDAGVTHQYGIMEAWKVGHQKNVRYEDNVFEKCNYSVEYFLTADAANPSTMENILVARNLMFDAGFGYCRQRPDTGGSAHIKSWRGRDKKRVRNRATGFTVTDNVFCRSQDMLTETCCSLPDGDASASLPLYSRNVFIGRKGQRFGAISSVYVKDIRYSDDAVKLLDSRGAGNVCLFAE